MPGTPIRHYPRLSRIGFPANPLSWSQPVFGLVADMSLDRLTSVLTGGGPRWIRGTLSVLA